MKTQFTATVVGGGLQLDEQLSLPDQCRVRVEVVPLEDARTRSNQAWEEWKQLNQQHPLHLGGERFNRDELYERG